MQAMRVCIHRGSREIGGTVVEIEAAGETLLLDAGLPLVSDADKPSWVPDLNGRSPRAIVITHSHLDHCGLLPRMPVVPVAMGAAARRILRTALPYLGMPAFPLDGPDLIDRRPIDIGPFRITPYLVDHSAYDAYALLIEADGRRLFYSGDIRAHGRKSVLVERLIASPPAAIDALLMEGSTLGRDNNDAARPETESELQDRLVRTFTETPGMALVRTSAQNVDRLVSIFRACLITGRTLLIDLYTAEILAATGNRNIPQSDWNGMRLCIPKRQRIQIKRNGWFDVLARHSGNRVFLKRHVARNPGAYALIFRGLWMRDLDESGCLDGACLIHSQWAGYLGREQFKAIDIWRRAHDMPLHQIHTSGHASPTDLKRIALALAPELVVPIHSDVPERYADLYPNVVRHNDGEWWNV
jgi:ribonuclease J